MASAYISEADISFGLPVVALRRALRLVNYTCNLLQPGQPCAEPPYLSIYLSKFQLPRSFDHIYVAHV
jgi:hypothetical protein